MSNIKMNTTKLIIGGFYRHYSNEKLYKVLYVGRHTETLDELVCYEAQYNDPVYGNKAIWYRPKELFIGSVQYRGNEVPRFSFTGIDYLSIHNLTLPDEA